MEAWSLFGLSEHLERLSKTGDPLEVLEATVDFEHFRGWLVEGKRSLETLARRLAVRLGVRRPGSKASGRRCASFASR
jgi:hypothetical protein